MSKKRIRFMALALSALIISALFGLILYENKNLEVQNYTLQNKKIPESFTGFRIVQISDLHNAEFGKNNIKLINMIKDEEPDIIVITGDLIDSRRTDIDAALSFVKQAVEFAPIYYVTGNHESRISEYDYLKESLRDIGVTVLEDEEMKIERNGEHISLVGVNDPDFIADYLFDETENRLKALLAKTVDTDYYTVLLSHRPELFEIYAESGVDLALSGHAHGGQFRLPFIGGIYAPGQGFFPEYDSEYYSAGDTTMIVSRGLGNSLIPLRINNRPEITVIELEH